MQHGETLIIAAWAAADNSARRGRASPNRKPLIAGLLESPGIRLEGANRVATKALRHCAGTGSVAFPRLRSVVRFAFQRRCPGLPCFVPSELISA